MLHIAILGPVHTGCGMRRLHKLDCFSFDVACMQCGHPHSCQQVPFACIALCCASCVDWASRHAKETVPVFCTTVVAGPRHRSSPTSAENKRLQSDPAWFVFYFLSWNMKTCFSQDTRKFFFFCAYIAPTWSGTKIIIRKHTLFSSRHWTLENQRTKKDLNSWLWFCWQLYWWTLTAGVQNKILHPPEWTTAFLLFLYSQLGLTPRSSDI